MIDVNKESAEHEGFKQLAAMAALNELTAAERLRLEDHLGSCKDCVEVYQQYLFVYDHVLPFIGSQREPIDDPPKWAEGPWRERLFRKIQTDEQKTNANRKSRWSFIPSFVPRLTLAGSLLIFVVSCLSFFLGGKVLGRLWWTEPRRIAESQHPYKDRAEVVQDPTEGNLQRRLSEQTAKVQELESSRTNQEQHLEKMRADLRSLTEREAFLLSSNETSKSQLKELTEQRDSLKGQIGSAEESYAAIQSRLAVLLSERDAAVARNGVLESKVEKLSLQLSNQERQIAEDEQYLNSDRDIRELMGARQLYIADVFDVDSHSQTRPPFGRIFYTRGKSLIFYAFDLDNQKDAVTASAFQAWGKSANTKLPRSLGILYLDNESNRRWLLRSDNGEQLEKIDSVFVTVEPRGGSSKPTGKPFLYALLRKEANHP
jgi:hypothetical protein